MIIMLHVFAVYLAFTWGYGLHYMTSNDNTGFSHLCCFWVWLLTPIWLGVEAVGRSWDWATQS